MDEINKTIIIELIMMCAYVTLISGVVISLFGLQDFNGWINLSFLTSDLSIYIGIVLIITGYLTFRFCLNLLFKIYKNKFY